MGKRIYIAIIIASIFLSIIVVSIMFRIQSDKTKNDNQSSYNELRNVYFGDIHVHTSFDIDSRMGYSTNTPDDAYRFAKGEVSLPIAQAAPNPPNVSIRISKPLDFAAVTAHAEMMAMTSLCLDENNKEKYPDIYNSQSCEDIRNYNAKGLYEEETALASPRPHPPADISKPVEGFPDAINSISVEASKRRWEELQEVANRHYEKGKFTTFIAYEFTPHTNTGGSYHRNILFRNDSVPENVLSAYNVYTASDLWRKLDEACNEVNNCEAIVIPHMSNVSDGMFFAKEDRQDVEPNNPDNPSFEMKVFNAEDYERRVRLEPLIEIFQSKGNSECLYGVGGAINEKDEFESLVLGHNKDVDSNLYPDVNAREDSYVRNGLKKGLVFEDVSVPEGFNPFKYGFIGGTDNQNGTPGATEEYQYMAQGGVAGATPDGRLTQQPKATGSPLRFFNPGGLTGVWAEENSRDAIFDALQRKEVFATSGTRISIRFFASFNFPRKLDQYSESKMIEKAYKNGVPMGGDIFQESNKNQAPKFLVWATKDPLSANLQRIQIVKGWADSNGTHEKVYDVVCSDGHNPDEDHNCSDNGATVDLKNCEYSQTIGATELKVLWTDPDFVPAQRAFYYARVLENPTCRWSTYDANTLGIEPLDDVPATIQERAWSSPIWYNPSNIATD